jgi:hypothetical protein
MTTLTVYDPPMCCSTGVCGPDVDPRLAQFAGDLDWLKGQGVDVRRINLAQEPSAFAENPEVKALLERSGDEDLPAIVVGTRLVSQGRYPTRAELAAAAGVVGVRPADCTVSVVSEEVRELIALGAAGPTNATASSCCGGSAKKEPAEINATTSSCCGGSGKKEPAETKAGKCC